MKRTIKQLILTAFAVACVACGDDANVLVTGYGDVAIRVEVDPSVTEVGDATPVELPAPTLDLIVDELHYASYESREQFGALHSEHRVALQQSLS